MRVAVVCPKCAKVIEITTDLMNQPVHCPTCESTFVPGNADPFADAIQTETNAPHPQKKAEPKPISIEMPSSPRPTARPPFPTVPLLVCALGILFFLLIVSGIFNFWFLARVDNPFQKIGIAEAEERARQAQIQAQRDADAARAAEAALQRERKRLQDQIDDLKQALEAAKKELDEAKKKEKAHADPGDSRRIREFTWNRNDPLGNRFAYARA